MVEVGTVREVRHAVGTERYEGLDVIGRSNSDGLDTAQLPDVAADLVGRMRVAPNQLEAGVANDGAHSRRPGLAGRPLDHLQPSSHSIPFENGALPFYYG